MYKVTVLASTQGTNFQSIIDAIQAGKLKNVEVNMLITNDFECGAVKKAEKAGIRSFCIFSDRYDSREEYDKEIDKVIQANGGTDLIVLGGWMRILSPWFAKKYAGKIINIHPSLLPKFAGGMNMDVHQAVIDAGEKETGMTIHFVDEGVDSGKIILQKSIPVKKYEKAKKLKAKVQELEKEWYPKVIQRFADGEIKIEGDQVTIK